MRSPQKDQGGMALIAALLIMMVCTILVAGALQLATHATQRSGLDRNRTAALHAAEAGIEADIAKLSDGTCPTVDGAETTLPDQNLPTESYKILAPKTGTCTVGGNATVAVVGYVPNATRPVATTTIVAHMNRGAGAPVSPSGVGNGGYLFPDALFTDGDISAPSGDGLSLFGLGGTVPSVVAGGKITISDTAAGGQLDGLVHGWDNVSLTNTAVGGVVQGKDVALTTATVHGNVIAAGDLNLSSTTTVNGTATWQVSNSSSGAATVTGGAPSQAAALVQAKRPMPFFSDNMSDTGALLGVGTAAVTTCPGTVGTAAYYDITGAANCTYNVGAVSGNVVIVAHGGTLSVTVPQTSTGQLYVVNDGGGITLTGTNSTMPVFAYANGAFKMSGTFAGQVAARSITATAPTTMTFQPPAPTMPNMAFPGGYIAPGSLGYAATVAFEYECPGAAYC